MAINRATLDEISRQYAAIGIQLGDLDKALADIWTVAWHDMRAELERLGKRLPRVGALARAVSAERALAVLGQAMLAANQQAAASTIANAQQLIAQAQDDVRAMIATQLPDSQLITLAPQAEAATASITARVIGQVTARHYFLQEEATQAMKRALMLGLTGGLNPKDVAQRMIDDVHGVFNGGLHRARVIARTEIIDAYRMSQRVEEQRHKDILAGWQWVAELSERTCASCVAMHGTIHPLDEPGPLDHQQGRCTRTPVTRTWKELGFDGIDEPPGLPQPGDGEKWLAKQPEDVQRHILGNKGYEAWQAGAWPSSQWARRRSTDGWRDSYVPAKPPARFSPDSPTKLAKDVLAKAKEAEPRTTNLMKQTASKFQGRLAGLKFRLKTEESLTRKIISDAEEAGGLKEAAGAISDALRYTIVFPERRYSERAVSALKHLEERGFSARVKNFWLKNNNPYQGVNVALTDKTGQRVELQFHTEKSLEIKEGELHKLYEKQRTLPKDDPGRAKLDKMMMRESRKIPVPPGIEEIK